MRSSETPSLRSPRPPHAVCSQANRVSLLSMAFYRSVGGIPPKRHTAFRAPDGRLYAEELMGEEGFTSDSSLLYHRGIPSAMSGAEPWQLPDLSTAPNHPLRPFHFRLPTLFAGSDPAGIDLVTGRRLVLGNADV